MTSSPDGFQYRQADFDYLSWEVRWLVFFAIGLRILLDFSGYSDMAIGFARMMGIRLPENFRWPYFASSIIDFWRRWHISLSSWIRDYVYIPLGEAGTDLRGKHLMLLPPWHCAGFGMARRGILCSGAYITASA